LIVPFSLFNQLPSFCFCAFDSFWNSPSLEHSMLHEIFFCHNDRKEQLCNIHAFHVPFGHALLLSSNWSRQCIIFFVVIVGMFNLGREHRKEGDPHWSPTLFLLCGNFWIAGQQLQDEVFHMHMDRSQEQFWVGLQPFANVKSSSSSEITCFQRKQDC